MIAATVAALMIVVRLSACSSVLLLVHLSRVACNTAIRSRRNGFFFARCSHFNNKTESKDGQERGEMSHTRSFSISKLLRLIDPKSCNNSGKFSWGLFARSNHARNSEHLAIRLGDTDLYSDGA